MSIKMLAGFFLAILVIVAYTAFVSTKQTNARVGKFLIENNCSRTGLLEQNVYVCKDKVFSESDIVKMVQ